MPVAMQAHIAGADTRTRAANLRLLALKGLQAVEGGADLTEWSFKLRDVGQGEGRVAVTVKPDTPLADAIEKAAAGLFLWPGTVFLLLAILGWERSGVSGASPSERDATPPNAVPERAAATASRAARPPQPSAMAQVAPWQPASAQGHVNSQGLGDTPPAQGSDLAPGRQAEGLSALCESLMAKF